MTYCKYIKLEECIVSTEFCISKSTKLRSQILHTVDRFTLCCAFNLICIELYLRNNSMVLATTRSWFDSQRMHELFKIADANCKRSERSFMDKHIFEICNTKNSPRLGNFDSKTPSRWVSGPYVSFMLLCFVSQFI